MGSCLNKDTAQTERKIAQSQTDSELQPCETNAINSTDLQSPAETKAANKEINKVMKQEQEKDMQVMKVLLLGAGSSGKTTLFRQIEVIHGNEEKSNNRLFVSTEAMKEMIRYNCVSILVKFLEKSEVLSQPPHFITSCKVDTEDPAIKSAIECLVEFRKNKMQNMFETEKCSVDELKHLGEAMQLLWSLQGVKETYKRRQFFSCMENMDYFLDKITAVMDESEENRFIPNVQDVIHARMKTTGIVQRQYEIKNVSFHIFDVGGQRNERRKWIQLFDNVNAVIFVAALNHYSSVLFEDETVNAMQESLDLFDKTLNSGWFDKQYTQFILFLNKNDLFINRLRDDKVSLSLCFGEKWRGSDFGDRDANDFKSAKDEKAWFNTCYHEALVFIKGRYLKKGKDAQIFTHITTATEKNNVKKVFDDVRTGIISHALQTSVMYIETS
mmetsp:Transcript_26130/g.42699  ORF Transcript_26130/g.42699 Transcript_26130/m.42699 type:complete len:442 (+) Transcript_26130:48-1373(+)